MCAHIGQNRHIYRRVYSAYIFDSYTPSPYSAGSSWGLLSRKIFFDFYFSDFHSYLSEVWIEIIFLNFTLVILTPNNFLFFRFSYSIPTRILFFYFFKTLLQLVKFSLGIPYQLLSFLVLYSFDYDFEFTSYRWELWLRYNFSISYFRFWISTCFSIVDSMLWLFNSLSL